LRSAVKSVVRALEASDKEQAKAAFKAAEPVMDRMANRGIIHKNTAARHKRRLLTRIRALG